jgi:hypothetical protein
LHYDINETCLVGKALYDLEVEEDSTSVEQPAVEDFIAADFGNDFSKSIFNLKSFSYTSS